MNNILVTVTILSFLIISCNSNQLAKSQDKSSKPSDNKEFQADLSNVEVNSKLTALLDGQWIIQSGENSFLNTTLKTGNKVFFNDTISSSMTGWGIIKFRRSANFYFTEYGSHMYEYYIEGNDKLVFTQYDYRNKDLSMKEKPQAIIIEMKIQFINRDSIIIDLNGKISELIRINTNANNK